jgi:DNA-binding PadR family transcriptional regulator
MGQVKEISKYLPLTEATSYILLALHEPLHGYGVIQKINLLSEGSVSVGPGTLYGAFTTLERDGLIAKVGDEDRRKIYRLTSLGRQVLQAQIHRLDILVQHARSIGE